MADAQTDDANTSVAPVLTCHAALSWIGSDGSPHQLCHSDSEPSRQVTLDVFFDAASAAALFRIRVPVEFKASLNEKTPLYLYIYADRVETLSRESSSDIPEEIRRRLGTQPASLRFGLNKPADLIAPSIPLVPARRKGHGERLDAVKLLAQTTSWFVYLAAGPPHLDTLLDKLCAAVAERGLRPLPVAAPSGLYAGKGGRVLGDSDLAAPQPPPPSYDELETSNHRGASSSGRLKRRREHGDTDIEAVCTGVVERIMLKHRDEERSFLMGELKGLKTDMMAYIDSRVKELEDKVPNPDHTYTRDEVDEELERVVNHNEDVIDVKLDDLLSGVKVELEEYVQDQFEGMEERMVERLRTASVVLDIAD